MTDELVIDAEAYGGPLDGAEGVIEFPAPEVVRVSVDGVEAEYRLEAMIVGHFCRFARYTHAA